MTEVSHAPELVAHMALRFETLEELATWEAARAAEPPSQIATRRYCRALGWHVAFLEGELSTPSLTGSANGISTNRLELDSVERRKAQPAPYRRACLAANATAE